MAGETCCRQSGGRFDPDQAERVPFNALPLELGGTGRTIKTHRREHDSESPARIDVDDLRKIARALERADELIVLAADKG